MATQYTQPSHFVNGWTVVDESTLTEEAKKQRAAAQTQEFLDHYRLMHEAPETINVRHKIDPAVVISHVIPEQQGPTGVQPARHLLVLDATSPTPQHYSETTAAGSLFYGDAAKNNGIIEHNLLLQAAAGGGTIQLRTGNSPAFDYRVSLIAAHHGIKVMNADNTVYAGPGTSLTDDQRRQIEAEVGATPAPVPPPLPEGGFGAGSTNPNPGQDPKDQVISELRAELATLRTEVEELRRADIARAGQTSTSQTERLEALARELAETKQQMAGLQEQVGTLSTENENILRGNEELLEEARTFDQTLAALRQENARLQEEVARLSKPGEPKPEETKPEEPKDKPEATAEEPKTKPEAAPRVDHPKYAEAVKIAAEDGVVSIGRLQTRLKLGYSDAEGMLNALEQDGVIGPRGNDTFTRTADVGRAIDILQKLNPSDPAMLAAVRAQAPQFAHAMDVTARGWESRQGPQPVPAAREDVEAAYAKLTRPTTSPASKGVPESEPVLV